VPGGAYGCETLLIADAAKGIGSSGDLLVGHGEAVPEEHFDVVIGGGGDRS
jgi:hypothetical protein